jgi:hypothetical protein
MVHLAIEYVILPLIAVCLVPAGRIILTWRSEGLFWYARLGPRAQKVVKIPCKECGGYSVHAYKHN